MRYNDIVLYTVSLKNKKCFLYLKTMSAF